jgi:hypothetical protein
MPGLQDIPFLSGYLATQQSNQQQGLNELRQASGLMGLLGEMQKQQQAQQAAQRQEQYRTAIGAATTPEDAVAVATKFAGPDDVLKIHQGSLDRKAAAEQRAYDAAVRIESMKDMQRERIDAQIQSARERGANAELLRQMQIEGQERLKKMDLESREYLMRLGASMRPAQAPTVVEIVDPNDPSKSIKIDAKTREKIGDAPRSAAGRPLPAPLQKQLTEAAELADATTRFSTTFKDDFGGKTVTGGLGNTVGRIMGDDTGQSQWWQDYELHQSQIRNKLFGSALTAPEIAAWEKSAINPRMEAKQIKENLGRRDKLEQTAINRLMRGAAVTYNREAIEAFTGRPIDGRPAEPAAPAAPSGYQEGQTATGRGGAKIIFKGGKWQPIQ